MATQSIEEQITEYFDSPEELERKAKVLADLISASHHLVVFTGAGVSTAAGIPDFRGPDGVWTLEALQKERTSSCTGILDALPTLTHMSLVELENRGILKFVISQNVDGMHRKSGILNLSELHGNANIELCIQCNKKYIRDYDTMLAEHERFGLHDHRTGRKCPTCKNDLYDTIINFDEKVPIEEYRRGEEHVKQSDLLLVLGSSLTVTPACHLPPLSSNLVICNLQKTPFDDKASLRIFAKVDQLMALVFKHLQFPIPKWYLHRRLVVQELTGEDNTRQIIVQGQDRDGSHFTFIRALHFKFSSHKDKLAHQPFRTSVDLNEAEVKIKLYFYGHYKETPLAITHTLGINSSTMYLLDFDPFLKLWSHAKL